MTKNYLSWLLDTFETSDLPGVWDHYKVDGEGRLLKAQVQEHEVPPSEWGGDPSTTEFGLIGRRRDVIVGWEPITTVQVIEVTHRLTGERFRLAFTPTLTQITPVYAERSDGNPAIGAQSPPQAPPTSEYIDQRIQEILRGTPESDDTDAVL